MFFVGFQEFFTICGQDWRFVEIFCEFSWKKCWLIAMIGQFLAKILAKGIDHTYRMAKLPRNDVMS